MAVIDEAGEKILLGRNVRYSYLIVPRGAHYLFTIIPVTEKMAREILLDSRGFHRAR